MRLPRPGATCEDCRTSTADVLREVVGVVHQGGKCLFLTGARRYVIFKALSPETRRDGRLSVKAHHLVILDTRGTVHRLRDAENIDPVFRRAFPVNETAHIVAMLRTNGMLKHPIKLSV